LTPKYADLLNYSKIYRYQKLSMPNYLNVETGGEVYGIYNRAIAILEFIPLAHRTLIFSFLPTSLSSSEFC
jgi:hypothetical protein